MQGRTSSAIRSASRLVHALERNAELLGKPGLRDLQGLKELLAEDLARVNRVPIRPAGDQCRVLPQQQLADLGGAVIAFRGQPFHSDAPMRKPSPAYISPSEPIANLPT